MRFGPVPLDLAEGAILAHAAKLPDGRLPKGMRLSAGDVARLKAAGLSEVVAAVLEPGDFTEDEAAERLAAAGGSHVEAGPAGTGRVNFFADAAGLFVPDRRLVDALNALDPGITLATLAAFAPVESGRMVATVKIIPLAVPGASVEAALGLLAKGPAFRVAPYRAQRVALVQTELPGVKKTVLDKTRGVLEARLATSGSTIVGESRCPHRSADLAEALEALPDCDLTVVFGASAVIDAEDVIPAAVEAAGGRVLHLGMPVDPGNLLLLAERKGRPLIGAPGCARSIKENGFDWVLSRLLCDLDVAGEDIRGMGVGGLLMEIATRPAPRVAAATPGVIDAVILAAGRSSRMEGAHKLLARFDGTALIRRSAETALASGARRVHVVLGHRGAEVATELAGLDVTLVENADFAEGLSTSLRAGFRAALAGPRPPDGVLVMLADQPLLRPSDLDRLVKAFKPEGQGSIVIATDGGRRANPVVLSAAYAAEIDALRGDVGAKLLITRHGEAVREVELGKAAGVDVDTREAVEQAGGVLTS
ncbi:MULTISPECIES: NTP transferase domain-containing protein [unclassified Aureimonas]|uniref:NTP transferase domain-containing protein n=1 Tax=unclassified Aureimonas TaxID=2615206 RepID=UPI0006F8C310|nr:MULTISPECIES: molybdopterin-binding/glycosyltransferase family 2 protein [unclassified Aureimonas]KQT57452.1 4-diphosphocytidyl-2C-methyl-D-erythritol kinase [Aureimonas sp. Leaf427]KQT77131.1 4-diphosphocytidyl-2C-methyl-D-erythritol kinase [Aureimonas sp. Leaf460]